MSAQDTGGPAFPVSTANAATGHQDGERTWQFPSLSLRDYFAANANVDDFVPWLGVALLGRDCPEIRADPAGYLKWWAEYRSALRYIEADAMLKERNR